MAKSSVIQNWYSTTVEQDFNQINENLRELEEKIINTPSPPQKK